MNIKPKEGVLLIRKHKQTKLKADIAVEENDEDKTLLTGEVLEAGEGFTALEGKTIIFGKYALLTLVLKGNEYHLISGDDVVGTCDYKE